MKIKSAVIENLDSIMNMYASCVKGMIESGINQWDYKYPSSQIIREDISSGSYYIVIANHQIVGGININQKQDKEANSSKGERKKSSEKTDACRSSWRIFCEINGTREKDSKQK